MNEADDQGSAATGTTAKSRSTRQTAGNAAENDAAPSTARSRRAELDAADSVAPPPLEAASSAGSSAVKVTAETIIEAILFATDSPLPAAKIAQIMGAGDAKSVKSHIEALNRQYAENGRSFRIDQIAKGYQMLTVPAYNSWVSKVLRARSETKLSPAAMETLAIIAYKQPILRAEIEAIRGVAAGEIVNRLREMNLVKIVGRAEELGRPMLYGTTRRFLEVFGLASLDDLPQSEALGAVAGAENRRQSATEPNATPGSNGESTADQDRETEPDSESRPSRPSDALRDA